MSMLTNERMQQILEEEKYRHEVRKTLDGSSSPKQKGKVMEFLNSTFFLALLSSFLIPVLISYYKTQSQNLKEKEVLERKISSERDEIKNRIDIISKIDTSGISGDIYMDIKNAFIGSDSTSGFTLSEEFAKRNIFSLISDYKYDLGYVKGKKETDSIIARLPSITDALNKTYSYLNDLYPYMFDIKEGGKVIEVNKKKGMKNPSKIDFFTSGSRKKDIYIVSEILPQLRKFQ